MRIDVEEWQNADDWWPDGEAKGDEIQSRGKESRAGPAPTRNA